MAPSLTSTDATVDLEKSEAVMAAFRDPLPIGMAATPDVTQYADSRLSYPRIARAVVDHDFSLKVQPSMISASI